ncbi:macrodomain Ter protein MatP [Thorsellia kenyensis]|uniref:Macrodomain Ter protein MatP n=1 Tax=Thorsellia kenyensis TaxID=1549888 RepID=A0ABV6CCP1_9GAMM
MKYKKLENLESGWKWQYLVNKNHEGIPISKYQVLSEQQEAVNKLFLIENKPEEIAKWLDENLNPDLVVKLNQAIRARRKRYFNAENKFNRKKSIDLEYSVWHRLSSLSQKRHKTLSETIIQLIEEAEEKDKYVEHLANVKNDLLDILKK